MKQTWFLLPQHFLCETCLLRSHLLRFLKVQSLQEITQFLLISNCVIKLQWMQFMVFYSKTVAVKVLAYFIKQMQKTLYKYI